MENFSYKLMVFSSFASTVVTVIAFVIFIIKEIMKWL